MQERQAGFTLVELLIGAAVSAIAIGVLVALAARFTMWSSALDARVQSQGAAERLLERLASEAASAWAVYVPASDVLGNANGDGHEIDFFSEDGSHHPFSWAYSFDAARKTITRYAFAPGTAASAGEQIGPFDSFAADTISIDRIATVDGLFGGAAAMPVSYEFAAVPSAVGGNALVRVRFSARGVDRTEFLASETAPTTFTVVVQYTPSPPPAVTPTPVPLVLTTPTP